MEDKDLCNPAGGIRKVEEVEDVCGRLGRK